jgi:hypothetical protein
MGTLGAERVRIEKGDRSFRVIARRQNLNTIKDDASSVVKRAVLRGTEQVTFPAKQPPGWTGAAYVCDYRITWMRLPRPGNV